MMSFLWFMFGALAGVMASIVLMCVGGGNHEEEAYKEGYKRGHIDGMMEARGIWRGGEDERD